MVVDWYSTIAGVLVVLAIAGCIGISQNSEQGCGGCWFGIPGGVVAIGIAVGVWRLWLTDQPLHGILLLKIIGAWILGGLGLAIVLGILLLIVIGIQAGWRYLTK